MRVIPSCEACLYERQEARVREFIDQQNAKAYLQEIRNILKNRKEDDSAPYMIYLFNLAYEKFFGENDSYAEVKKQYNTLVLSMEDEIEKKIIESDEPLKTAFIYAQIGNYIDFGAMNHVEQDVFIKMLEQKSQAGVDEETYQLFLDKCKCAKRFLLLCDNCGEIVLDKLFVRQLKKTFPNLQIHVMVRGAEALNDATMEDAIFCKMNEEATVISNGNGVAGTVRALLSDEARTVFDDADVVLSKGQGNYESMADCQRDAFYSFLCKCDLFTTRFQVPKLTGMFVYQ